MQALWATFSTFLFLVLSHLSLMRAGILSRPYRSLVIMCPTVLVVALVAFRLTTGTGRVLPIAPVSSFDYVNFIVLYAALAIAWVVTYPPIQADSPSMTIVLDVDRAGPLGRSRAELLEHLDDAALILPRLEDLVTLGLVDTRQGRYVLRPAGAKIARFNLAFRALMKMEKGG
jgi:hypothetical protein